LNYFKKIFNKKKILVTGHTGFQGGWLSTWLIMLGADLYGFSLTPNTKPSLFKAINLEKKMTSIIGDIQDFENLKYHIKKVKPDFVFHLAAQPLVRESYENPLDTFHTNIIGTCNILEILRKMNSVKACVIMTSDKCYKNMELNHAYREIDPMGGHDPYSASKGAAELIISSYMNSFFKEKKNKARIATVRSGNVIGGGDWSQDRIIPDLVKTINSNQVLDVRNPNSIRPWQFVLEPISGMMLLASKMVKNEINSDSWNFGPNVFDSTITVRELVEYAINIWKHGKWKDVSNKKNLHEAKILRLDSTKSNNTLSWRPIYTFKDSIRTTIDWYKKYYRNSKVIDKFTEKQIEKYFESAKKLNIEWAL